MWLPLIDPAHPLRVIAWRGSREVSQQQYLADVDALAVRLPQARYALNLCEDRYHFMTAFAAVCLRGQTNLLPPSSAAGVIGDIADAHPDCYAIGDTECLLPSLPWIAVSDDTSREPSGGPVPVLLAEHIAALAFTSGSTGKPQGHPKTWGTLVGTARLAAQRFGGGKGSSANLVATVPPQHMYGLETTVMSALAGACAAHAGRPFFFSDLRSTLEQMPAPRVLITTPVHLRTCVSTGLPLPALSLIVCATAPLSSELATAAEAALGAPVHEIYGCTEAGSMATRRTVSTPVWQFYQDMHLSRRDGVDVVHGRHLPEPVALPDVVEDLGHGRFRLRGRSADLLKVAGKRGSLSELTSRLLRIPGVRDAVVFVPEPAPGGEARPAALVVAPDLSEPQILLQLQTMIDPAFLPRPLIRLPRLPRNAVGKLPRAALLAELERARA